MIKTKHKKLQFYKYIIFACFVLTTATNYKCIAGWGSDSESDEEIMRERKSHIPNDFDPETYLFLYPDVAAPVKNKSQVEKEKYARRHFRKWGIKTGRIYSLPSDFNHETYLSLNPDLNVIVETESATHRKEWASQHFAQHGHLERSYFPEDFDYTTYIYIHKDLQGNLNELNLLEQRKHAREHYAHFGRLEGRKYKLPTNFKPQVYLWLNPDLDIETNTLSQDEAVRFAMHHYAYIGCERNLPYLFPDDFNPMLYLHLNPSLGKLVNGKNFYEKSQILSKHFARQGQFDKFLPYFPFNFSGVKYFQIYPCLETIMPDEIISQSQVIETKARIHYAKYGYDEGRIFCYDQLCDEKDFDKLLEIQKRDHLSALEKEKENDKKTRSVYSVRTVRSMSRHVRRSSHKLTIDPNDLDKQDGTHN